MLFLLLCNSNPVQKKYRRSRTDRTQKQEYAEEPKHREWISPCSVSLYRWQSLIRDHGISRFI